MLPGYGWEILNSVPVNTSVHVHDDVNEGQLVRYYTASSELLPAFDAFSFIKGVDKIGRLREPIDAFDA
jgi:hypothetical protein